MKDPRFKEINELFINYALGNFDYKVEVTSKLDEIDAFISNINMLGEELKSTTISKNYFNNIFNSVSDMLFVLDNKKIIKNVNSTVIRKLGFSEKELINCPINQFSVTNRNIIKRKVENQESKVEVASEFESQLIGSNEILIPAYCTLNRLYNENNERIGFLLIARDLTTIKVFEKSLIESEERYRRIFEESSDAIFVIDKEGNFLSLNTAGHKLFGIPKKKAGKVNYFSLFANSVDVVSFKKRIAIKGFLVDDDVRLIETSGDVVKFLVSANILYDANQQVMGYQGIIKDIRRQKEIEAIIIRTIIDTQERERERFAQDLHDSLGQQLSGIKFQMEILKKTISRSVEESEVILSRSNEALNTAILELRSVCFNLMPRTLDDFGLSYSINDLCRKVSLSQMVEFNIDIDEGANIDNKSLKVAIFRIIQEFINNSIKHGKARKVWIGLKSSKEILTINLKDNGIGFNVKTMNETKGMGLRNVVSRVESYKGEAKILSSLNRGTTYRIKFKLN